MDIVSLTVFAVALLVNSGTPGPSIIALVSRVITNGWRDVMPFLAAMWIGEVIWLTMAIAGLTVIANTLHGVFFALKWLGIAYLCWMAWKMWQSAGSAEREELPKRSTSWSMFAAGMALTLGNPKIIVFYLALLPTFFDIGNAGLELWLALSVVTLIVLAAVDCIWIFFADRARAALKTPKARKITNRVAALALGGAAGVIATK